MKPAFPGDAGAARSEAEERRHEEVTRESTHGCGKDAAARVVIRRSSEEISGAPNTYVRRYTAEEGSTGVEEEGKKEGNRFCSCAAPHLREEHQVQEVEGVKGREKGTRETGGVAAASCHVFPP